MEKFMKLIFKIYPNMLYNKYSFFDKNISITIFSKKMYKFFRKKQKKTGFFIIFVLRYIHSILTFSNICTKKPPIKKRGESKWV